MMNPEVKKLWVAALRDPATKQGRYVLENLNGEQCCLGVLCRIAEREGIIKQSDIAKRTARLKPAVTFCNFVDHLPPEVKEWAGVDGLDIVCINRESKSLVNHNDDGATFPEIADAVESQL